MNEALRATPEQPYIVMEWSCYRHPNTNVMAACYKGVLTQNEIQFPNDELFISWVKGIQYADKLVESKRIEDIVQVVCPIESGLLLRGKDETSYVWYTKNHNHPFFFASDDDYYHLRMTLVKEDGYGKKTVKNVRIVKGNKQ